MWWHNFQFILILNQEWQPVKFQEIPHLVDSKDVCYKKCRKQCHIFKFSESNAPDCMYCMYSMVLKSQREELPDIPVQAINRPGKSQVMCPLGAGTGTWQSGEWRRGERAYPPGSGFSRWRTSGSAAWPAEPSCGPREPGTQRPRSPAQLLLF